MARFVVERSFPDGMRIPLTEQGAQACLSVVGTNAELGVTWLHSYVTHDHKKTFCIYDAPNPEANRVLVVIGPFCPLDHGWTGAGDEGRAAMLVGDVFGSPLLGHFSLGFWF